MTPKNLQDLIWEHYVEGQEERKDPTDAYLEAQELVVRFVESRVDGKPILPIHKVLSLTQPWASLVVVGAKGWETRSRRSRYVGPLIIHASVGYPTECRQLAGEGLFAKALRMAGYPGIGDPYDMGKFNRIIQRESRRDTEVALSLPVGKLLGRVNMKGCTPILMADMLSSRATTNWVQRPKISDQEWTFGAYEDGRFAYELTDPVRFENPRPAKGALGLWEYAGELA